MNQTRLFDVDAGMIKVNPIPRRPPEEWANTITHGLGLLLSLVGLVALVVAAIRHDALVIVACTVFGLSLIALYAASTFYHGAVRPRWKTRLRLLDHLAILYLIAGSYTPFVLVSMRTWWGYLMLTLVWSLAIGGTLFKVLSKKHRFHNGGTALYLAMGWLSVCFAAPMIAALPRAALMWLALGGLCYTGGVVFYLWERWRYAHAVWHVFVLAGSACHFAGVWSVLL